jgi:hypothetical protein
MNLRFDCVLSVEEIHFFIVKTKGMMKEVTHGSHCTRKGQRRKPPPTGASEG